LRSFATLYLPASYNQIATGRIHFDQASLPASPFGGEHRRPDASERVEHGVTAL
jgi:hypothetical protein